MRLFPLLDYQHLLLALFLGFIGALSIYAAFRHRSRPVPAILVLLYIGFAVWALCYIVFVALPGGAL
ncbi:MAG: hypothetical protein A4E57_02337 [Syntrophorhabdaceae bacterium PtaU1.Bin034]|nr:MAG: hypothetical protein A4E57_02337 [Syntrophorhabdaceae bacterium PtaU1.Bin034]